VGVAERDEDLGTLRRLHRRTGSQGRRIVRRRLGVRQRGGGLPGRRELPRGQAIAGQRAGAAQMPDDLACSHLARVVALGEDVGDVQVQPRAAGGRQRGDDRLGDERVGERVAAPSIGRGDEPGGDRAVQRLEHLDDRPVVDAGQRLDVELEAADGGHVERADGGVVEACEPVRDHVAHPRRGTLDLTARLLRFAQQLVEEERVAAAARAIAPRGLVVGRPEAPHEQRADGVLVQARQVDMHERSLPA
jgi:hypothetical protein